MRRREFIAAVCALPGALEWEAPATLRGRLRHDSRGRPHLVTAAGQTVYLEGDEETQKVLADARLAGFDLELWGELAAPDRFRVGPFHLKSLLVVKGGQRYIVTYWCDVCSIRSYTPGLCVCCQEETQLDLRPQEN